MVVTSESELRVPDLIAELQSSGHIIEVQSNKSSGIIVIVTCIILKTTILFHRSTDTGTGQI